MLNSLRRLTLALLLVTTVVVGIGAPTVTAQAATSWGSVGARDQTLEQRCHGYRYRYAVTTPTDDWAVETFLVNPHGKRIGSGYILSDLDAASGTRSFRICRPSTVPGRHTITMKISSYDGREESTRWMSPASFRLTRR